MPNKKGCKVQNPNSLSQCVECKKTYTLHMMKQIYSWSNEFKCIRCHNLPKNRHYKSIYTLEQFFALKGL